MPSMNKIRGGRRWLSKSSIEAQRQSDMATTSDSDFEYLDCDWDYDGDGEAFSVFKTMHSGYYGTPACFSTICVNDSWNEIPVDIKKSAGHLMRLHTYWLPLLLRNDTMNETFNWATSVGVVNAHDPTIVNLKTLRKIETLEAILRAMEIGSFSKEQMSHLIVISASFSELLPEALEEALLWLELTGEPEIEARVLKLGHKRTCYAALCYIFRNFALYVYYMGTNMGRMIDLMRTKPPEHLLAESDVIKKQGNDLFQEEKYEEAAAAYSKAIKYFPENHIIFGNRALCYIRCKKYTEAAADGKRATLIEPLWPKGHYRYCEALFLLGEVQWALGANISAQNLCKHGREGVKDLEQQHQKFVSETKGSEGSSKNNQSAAGTPKKNPNAAGHPKKEKSKAGPPKKDQNAARLSKKDQSTAEPPKKSQNSTKLEVTTKSSKTKATNKSNVAGTQEPSGEGDGNGSNNNKSNGVFKVNKLQVTSQAQHSWKTPLNVAGAKMTKQSQPVVKEKTAVKTAPAATKELPNTPKEKSKSSKNQPEQADPPEATDRAALIIERLRVPIQDAHSSLTSQCSYNSERAFRQALALLDTNPPEEIGMSALDMQLLLYGRVSALTQIGKPEGLAEARRLLEKIESYEERLFQCLVCYAYGKIYLKENRFAVALKHFQDSMQMVRNRVTPGKLTWPLTKEVVKETELNHFKKILDDSIYLCKFPPRPDSTCRHVNCLCPSKNMYITDPDFKGFVQLKCSHKCLIEYHNACWKTLKPLYLEGKEKPCLTPDCSGIIDSIQIIDPTGQMKCKILLSNQKAEIPKKPKVKQKLSGVKKLKEKSHFKRENNNKQTLEKKPTISNEVLLEKNNTVECAQQNAWLLYRDRVLLQIRDKMQLLRQEKGLTVSAVSAGLGPWLELDSGRGNHLASKMLNWEQEHLETLDQVVELLLERKNRVWARVFIQLLSSTLDVNVELSCWAGRLNDADLKAAKSFVERNADSLYELDLTPVLNFAPLKEIISESPPPGPNLISSHGLTKYVKQPSPHEMRLFIWTLEEHRDIYVSCNILLDEYFDMMDGHCSVLKKSDSQNSFPASVKSRARKKMKNKGLQVWSWPRNNVAADEWDQEDPIYFPDPNDPFSTPSHLRKQLFEFEEQYNSTRHTRDFKKSLDNNPDPTEKDLYNYFAQILDQHGPLLANDPLLLGEVENFPPVAKAKLQKAGSLERFLLQSLRFIKIGSSFGLAKHAVALQDAAHVDHPQPLPVFSSTQNATSILNNVDTSITFHMDQHPPPVTKAPVNQAGSNKISPNYFKSLDLYTSEVEEPWETYSCTSGLSSTRPEEVILKKHAEVQTYQAIKDCVAVNTEPWEPYESLQGDKKVKSNKEMEEQMSKMANYRKEVDQKHKETLMSLEKDIQEISTNIQVTNKELALFQQKLEEEVKKDQKEKKANQEVLKTLKMEMEKLVEEQRSLTEGIRANKASYEEELNKFLELSNQSEAEKMSLEDEIKRCKNSVAAATRKSHTAQLSMLKSKWEQRSYGLRVQLADAKSLLVKLNENVQRFPPLEASGQNVRAKVRELEQKITAAETQYKVQVEELESGQRVKDILGTNQSDPQLSLLSSGMTSLSVAPAPSPQSIVPSVSASPVKTRKSARSTQAGNTVFEKAMERLATIFPDYTRSDLMRFLKHLRSSNGDNLINMSLQDVVSGVSHLILDQQEAVTPGAKSKTTGVGGMATPLPVDPRPVWQKLAYQRPLSSSALNLEDPCIICHEEMSECDRCVLECRHTFHKQCITSWLKTKSTCPTCRKHSLLLDDFPALPSRRRQAQ
ncbi:E3 ubiquitin-protein ligase TTC3 isoform X2 [Phyllopteryx taeniolatus]|uniref:E3 ubiquitin-protein ligase TTC3 isoform X2 n=1 Tax=Phyllopteryx taeniolatus TaxID=161469 RepID=UPI002AD4FDE0|nr:E3 ubiquitin-protein ligase TTC3 isoform X2 [Phyllopteryx taeniolatus]